MAPGARNGGSAGIPSLEPLRWGCPHGNVSDPELLEIWGAISGSLQALLSPIQQQGAGRAGGAQPQPGRDLPQLFPSPKENRACLERWARPRREGRKEPFSKTLLPGKRSGGEGGGGRARIAALSWGCQVDFLPLPARTPALRSPHVVRFFQLLVSIITPRQSERGCDK